MLHPRLWLLHHLVDRQVGGITRVAQPEEAGLLADAGEHEDRDIPPRPPGAAQAAGEQFPFHAAAEHQVQDEQVGRVFLEDLLALGGVGANGGIIAAIIEMCLDYIAKISVVIENQNPS